MFNKALVDLAPYFLNTDAPDDNSENKPWFIDTTAPCHYWVLQFMKILRANISAPLSEQELQSFLSVTCPFTLQLVLVST